MVDAVVTFSEMNVFIYLVSNRTKVVYFVITVGTTKHYLLHV